MSNTNISDKIPALLKPSVVSFHIFRKDGSRNPDIKHSFLERRNISIFDAQEGFLMLDDATQWKLILEPKVSSALISAKEVFCLLSFQARISGNFVVARLFNEAYKSKGRHSK